METKEVKWTVLTLEKNGCKTMNSHSGGDMYELLCSFIGACSSVGFPIETIHTVIKEYAETIEEDND